MDLVIDRGIVLGDGQVLVTVSDRALFEQNEIPDRSVFYRLETDGSWQPLGEHPSFVRALLADRRGQGFRFLDRTGHLFDEIGQREGVTLLTRTPTTYTALSHWENGLLLAGGNGHVLRYASGQQDILTDDLILDDPPPGQRFSLDRFVTLPDRKTFVGCFADEGLPTLAFGSKGLIAVWNGAGFMPAPPLNTATTLVSACPAPLGDGVLVCGGGPVGEVVHVGSVGQVSPVAQSTGAHHLTGIASLHEDVFVCAGVTPDHPYHVRP